MPAAADWITLAEAAEILAAANVQFRPETIGAWARSGKPVEHQARRPPVRPSRRGPALVAAPRRVHAEDIQPGLFEDMSS